MRGCSEHHKRACSDATTCANVAQHACLHSSPEEDTAAVDAQAEVAPHIQDDFDLEEGVLQELDVKDNPDFQVWHACLSVALGLTAVFMAQAL